MMDNRAVSEVLSYTLVFALIVSTVGIVSISGLNSLDRAKTGEQLNNAERAFDIIADNIEDLYQRDAPSRATEFDATEGQLLMGEGVNINISVDGTTVLNSSTSPIEFRGDRERKLVYEGGAVFRETRNGALVVREPPITVQEDRILVQRIRTLTEAQQSYSGSTVLVRTEQRSSETVYANSNGNVENVSIRVTSPRAELWNKSLKREGFICQDVSDPNVALCNYDQDDSETPDINRAYIVNYDILVDIEL